MGLWNRSAGDLSDRTLLLFATDPGNALLDAVRLYDPGVRFLHGRLTFGNGVLLYGPVPVTSKLGRQAGVPAGMAVAYYTGTAVQLPSERRATDARRFDGDRLVHGLADRFGGAARYAGEPLDVALVMSVYGERALPLDRVIEVLRPYGGDLSVKHEARDAYTLIGEDIRIYYWPPWLYREAEAPPALGQLRSRPLHHWDLRAGGGRKDIAKELASRTTQASLALASCCGGVAVDELGFPVSLAKELRKSGRNKRFILDLQR